MIALATLLTLINQKSSHSVFPVAFSRRDRLFVGKVSEMATARPVFGEMSSTPACEEAALAQGFREPPPIAIPGMATTAVTARPYPVVKAVACGSVAVIPAKFTHHISADGCGRGKKTGAGAR